MDQKINILVNEVTRMVKESGDPINFDAKQWVLDWIQIKAPSLGGKKPVEFLETDDGLVIVLRILRQMQSGAYA